MTNLLEITGNDIAQLADDELRTLIGLLCEAEFRLAGLSTKGITWGGHQDAIDGGLDVVVRGEVSPINSCFIKKLPTGFQVKKPDMAKKKIVDEMQPNGILRDGIKNLINENGAYIIVSSGSSTTEKTLQSRLKAMKEAVVEEKGHQNIYLDFLDQGRIATWVRQYPFLILWVRNKIGHNLKGWHPYGNWSHSPGGTEEEYILDDGLRLHDSSRVKNEGYNVVEGLSTLRSSLNKPAVSIRLTGLSGVGKTRFVQALFDERVGKNPLNLSEAFYTDVSESPDPDPCFFAEQLIAYKTKAILIIDNCPPDLHRRLTKICSEKGSSISLLTVEYDVRDDLPEETSVYRLEPASEDIIEKLILRRFNHISRVDAKTIAIFSGGNARIAISLANTVAQGETLSAFRDQDLFERLFRQRNDPNENLIISAELLSLVYSFEGTDINTDKSELKFLASIISKPAHDLYRDQRLLKERDLLQSRGVWRAILPQAIANRLARRALESIPRDTIIQFF